MSTDRNIQFRIATLEDAPRLQQLIQTAFRAEDSRPQWTADMSLGASFTVNVQNVINQINKPEGGILVAVDGNDGAIIASIEVTRRGDFGRLSMIAVEQRFQQAGLGRRVLARAEDYCRQTWGVDKFSLDALSTRERLIEWYERQGYCKTGELTPFPVREIDGRPVGDDLCFVQMEKTPA
ncbi:hypothetical protein PFICI_03281 [Pestalotiopsis fici W106-1]|uniref:N-acetyltransferase domain-containing protein n=1 Tax=Pestalotiopsis fici (strain W106-1 / CGMCC3.15140) TaxID=1229662 RepID=W3XJ82_PESFW|nr:uncharacterized protein PFICI_03281 [Pestalotiopsis fici W106-1]ETS85256.1 hypothetical protein PFICI_03281 [Pestalotiopsis fici W106-1]